MRRFALLFIAIAAVATAQQKPAQQVAIEKQIDRYVKAMNAKNMAGVKSVMTSDFTASDSKGRSMSAKDAISQLEMIFKQATKVVSSTKIKSFKMEKGNARLVSNNTLDIDLNAGGKTAKLHNESTSDEIWVQSGGAWKIKSSKQLSGKATLNGKPFPGG
jgi:ketosteroid isomerase-like protein